MVRYSKYWLVIFGVKVVDNCIVCFNVDNKFKFNVLLKIIKNG